MRELKTLSLDEATAIANHIIKQAKLDGDDPIVVAVVGANAILIALSAMNGVMPISVSLAYNKAYSAVMGGKDTLYWEEEVPIIGCFGNPKFCCLGGGMVLRDSDGNFVGGIGVSGRRSTAGPDGARREDHELAETGVNYFQTKILQHKKTVSVP